MNKKFLCIGGPHDGKKIGVETNDTGQPVRRFIEIQTQSSRDEYRAERFIGKNEYFVYVHCSIDDPMGALIEGYAK